MIPTNSHAATFSWCDSSDDGPVSMVSLIAFRSSEQTVLPHRHAGDFLEHLRGFVLALDEIKTDHFHLIVCRSEPIAHESHYLLPAFVHLFVASAFHRYSI